MKLYNVRQATKFLGLKSRTTFYRYIQQGLIPEPHLSIPSGKVTIKYWKEENLNLVKPKVRKQGRPTKKNKEVSNK